MPRKTDPLTDLDCKKSKPKEKDYRLFDGGGLFLLVRATGSKLWHLKYRFQGKDCLMSIGPYPQIGLADARKERRRYKDMIAEGTSPAEQRRLKKQHNKSNDFKALALDWHQKQLPRWKSAKHARQVIDSLDKQVFPTLGDKDPSQIKPGEVLNVIRTIEARGAKEIANRVLQRINSVFIYGIAIGWCETNPAQNLNKALEQRTKGELSYMPFKDVPAFLSVISHSATEPQNIIAMKLLIHTFLRPGELRGALWSEIDFNNAIWRVTAERMKMKVEHLVPLSSVTLALLNELRPLTSEMQLMFPSRSHPLKPISENTLNHMIKRFGFTGTSHGFRKTASTWLNEQGYNRDAIERQLAHAEKDKVRAAYNKAQFLEERKEMMQAWSNTLEEQSLSTDNVASINKEEIKHHKK